MTKRPLVLLCAMHSEADAIIDALGLQPAAHPWPDHHPPRVWSGLMHNRLVYLAVNGRDPRTNAELIGTTPATLATNLVIEGLDPAHILIAGAAGGCAQTTTIGQVLLIDKAYHHDRRIPLPEFADYAHGPEPLHCTQELADAFNADIATISTGNALDSPPIDLAFFQTNRVRVKDMETASIAWVAGLSNTPVSALRAITDHYDHPSPEHQFLTNFEQALRNLAGSIQMGLEPLICTLDR